MATRVMAHDGQTRPLSDHHSASPVLTIRLAAPRRLGRNNPECENFRGSDDRYLDADPNTFATQQALQIVDTADRLTPKADDHISVLQPSPFGRTTWLNRHDHD